MQHYAIVKCERVELEAYYNNTTKWHDYWKNEATEALEALEKGEYNKNIYSYFSKSSWEERLLSYLDSWKSNTQEHYIGKTSHKNGLYTIWEGLVNQERLRVSDTLYIPNLEEYKEIKKVELKPSGEIVYYIDHVETFKTTYETSRVKAVEKWFEDFYPNYISYNELKEHKDERNSLIVEWEQHNKRAQKVLESEKRVPTVVVGGKEIVKNIATEKPVVIPQIVQKFDNDADEQWQNIVLFGFLGTIGIILLMLIFGLN